MYHSKHNNNITYFFTWGEPVKIEGKGELCREDADIGKDGNWTSEYSALHIKDGITTVKSGFLEQFSILKILVADRSVIDIELTEDLLAMFKKNGTIIRGCYDSYAEKFAEENGLLFIHKDIYIGICHYEKYNESRTLTLHFGENDEMNLLYEDFCQGISAGNTMGGKFTREMPEEFHRGCTLEEFAYMMPGTYFEQIMKNEELEAFLESYAKRK